MKSTYAWYVVMVKKDVENWVTPVMPMMFTWFINRSNKFTIKINKKKLTYYRIPKRLIDNKLSFQPWSQLMLIPYMEVSKIRDVVDMIAKRYPRPS